MSQYLPRLSSKDSHNFSRVPEAAVPRSVFDLSRPYKTAFDSGYLVPFFMDETVPGDTFIVNLQHVARLSTPIVPFMDQLYIDFHFFSVPKRLLWTNFVKMMGEQTDPGDSTSYTVPIVTAHAPSVGSLWDYLGQPTGAGNVTANAWWSRAYNFIYDEWYRDENLQDSVGHDTDDGPDSSADYVLLKRGKRHDYFTSCLPWPIKGTESTLELGTSAPVIGNGEALGLYDGTANTGLYFNTATADRLAAQAGFYGASVGYGTATGVDPVTNVAIGVSTHTTHSGLEADLSSAVGPTVNSFRETIYLQHMLERDARGGTRYCEIIRSHFNVTDPMSAILQRPLFLGGGTSKINITPVPQTSESNTTNQGTLAAVGYSAGEGIGFNQSFTEHCVILGLMSVRATMTYQRGLHRMYSVQTRAEHYWPSLAHLGEQVVYNREIYHQGTSADSEAFGYQERWGHMRYGVGLVTGLLRSDAASNVDEWHLAQDFGSLPTLGSTFIEENPPVSRVVATPSEPEIIFDGFINVKAARPMPTFSVPGMGTKL